MPGYNADLDSQCCPTSANGTSTFIENPQCANETWDLYNMAVISIARKVLPVTLLQMGVMGAQSRDMHFKMARSCYLLSELDKVNLSSCFVPD